MATLFFRHQVIPVMSPLVHVALPVGIDYAVARLVSSRLIPKAAWISGSLLGLAVIAFVTPKSLRTAALGVYAAYKIYQGYVAYKALSRKRSVELLYGAIGDNRVGDAKKLWGQFSKEEILLMYEGGEAVPIHWAVCSGKLEVVKCLLDQHEDLLNKGDNLGDAPLHVAAYYGRVEVAQWLMTQPNILLAERNKNGETPLHIAIRKNEETVVRALASPFFKAIEGDEIERVKKMHAADPDLLDQKKEGANVLHLAVEQGHLELAKDLYAAKPSLFAKITKENYDMLSLALFRERWELAKWAYTINPKLMDTVAIIIAVPGNCLDFFKWLDQENSALIKQHAEDLMFSAARNCKVDIAQWIYGKNPSLLIIRTNYEQKTPLDCVKEQDDSPEKAAMLKWINEKLGTG